VDITTRGQLTLLHRTAKVLALTNQDPAPEKLCVTDSYVYVAAGQPNVKKFAALDASDVTTSTTGTVTAQEVRDMATDGGQLYIALGPDGISKAVSAGSTQIDSMDSLTNWAFSGGASGDGMTLSTAFKKEGTGAVAFTSHGNLTSTVTRTFGAAQNYSAVNQFTIWHNLTNADTVGNPNVEFRFITSLGNYFTRTITSDDEWFLDTSNRATDWTAVGSPSWSNINSFSAAFLINGSTPQTLYIDDLEQITVAGFSIW
jgi:hypothetical protein